jgi:hypothetical protein
MATPRTRAAAQAALLLAVWLGLRVAFFEGLWGYDDLDHINYAMDPGPPADVFQARLMLNGMLAAVYQMFGAAEWVWALPTLLASLVFVLATWLTARRLFSEGAALAAGLLAATLLLDVTHSTDPGGSPLANAFATVGTGLLLTGEGRRRLVLAGAVLAGGMVAHLATALYVLPLIVAWALHDGRRWRESLLLFGVVAATWLVVDCTVFTVMLGDPLGHYRLLVGTHLSVQPYLDVPPRLADGSLNPWFFGWSLRGLVFTKHFGLLLGLSLLAGVLFWRRWDRPARLMVLALGLGWLYLSFGSQHPLGWAPLAKAERYWYPLALPAILLAVRALGEIRRPVLRYAWAGAIVLPIAPLLLAAGSWGQNVEVSRELAAIAAAHPERTFVTDPHTYDEIFLDGARSAPPNLAILDDGTPDLRPNVKPPRVAPKPGEWYALVNPMHLHRARARAFAEFVRGHMKAEPATAPTWRLIATLLPEDVRAPRPSLQRKPPAEIARFPDVPSLERGALPQAGATHPDAGR